MHSYERRTALTPPAVAELIQNHQLSVEIQRSPLRIYPAQLYRDAGARIVTELHPEEQLLFGVKQIPADVFKQDGVYVLFGHVTKGQPENMFMLQHILNARATYIDYEYIENDKGERLVAFGRFAGIVGMTDTLHLLGRRLREVMGIDNPFSSVKRAFDYKGEDAIDQIKAQMKQIGDSIERNGLPSNIAPMIVGFTGGTGRCNQGALEIFNALGAKRVSPGDLLNPGILASLSKNEVYSVEFDRAGFNGRYQRKDGTPGSDLDLEKDPEAYESTMGKYLHLLTIFMNDAKWLPGQPPLITREMLASVLSNSQNRLIAVGDVGCDVYNNDTKNGPMECTLKGTKPEDPFYVYNPKTGGIVMGISEAEGILVNAVETMPCELPAVAAAQFSRMLLPFVPNIARTNYGLPFSLAADSLPPEIRRAVIVWRGEFTPRYADNRVMLDSLVKNGGELKDENDVNV
jgi:alpha-aminoadipic semialdehyde synthase